MDIFKQHVLLCISYSVSFMVMVMIPASFLYYDVIIHNSLFITISYWGLVFLSFYGLYVYGYHKPMEHILLLSKSIVKMLFYILIVTFGIQIMGSAMLSFSEPFWFYNLSATLFKSLQYPNNFYWMVLISIHSLMCIVMIDYGDANSK